VTVGLLLRKAVVDFVLAAQSPRNPLNNLVSHYGRAGGFVIRLDRSADMRKGRSVSSHPILADH
jgi:hypothetical protein